MTQPTTYRIRNFRINDQSEIELVNLMSYHPSVAKAKGYYTRKFRRFAEVALDNPEVMPEYENTRVTRTTKDVSYAIADASDTLCGWIWFYRPTHPLPSLVSKRLGVTKRTKVFELSYEKLLHFDWPEELLAKLVHNDKKVVRLERKGVIVSSLALAIRKLLAEYHKVYVRRPKIVLCAYVKVRNTPSKIVLQRNGFTRENRVYRSNQSAHELWTRVL